MEESELIQISGTVDTVIFQNTDNGYAVLRLTTSNGEEVTATGCLPQIGAGETLELTGKWTTHPSYGEQFSVELFERRLPATVNGIADYLSSRIIKGIGPRLGRKIAEQFGEDTFDVLANHPDRLTVIRGITQLKAEEIQAQFLRQTAIRRLMEFLLENNLPLELASRLYNRFRDTAVERIERNPYLLCDELFDQDFRLADDLALSLGLSLESPERIGAGVLYTLRYNLQNGHSFIPFEKLCQAVQGLLLVGEMEVALEDIAAVIGTLLEQEKLQKEFICGVDAVYLKMMYDVETYLADYLYALSKVEYSYDFEIPELVSEIEKGGGIEFAPLQRKAIECAARYGLVILTGGPGTGKTTTVRGMIGIFEALGLNVVLAAPTGRAAKRLSELCGMEAKTIHRLLEAGYSAAEGRLTFQRGRDNPLDCEVVILDEVSMIDVALMHALVCALPKGARLVLVGDADQLPPVGPGNLLRDVIGARCIATIELTEIFRQAQTSDIVLNAHAINIGEMPVASGKDGDFFIMKKSSPAEVMDTVVQLCRDRLPRYYGLKPSQIQVLTPSRRQGAGTVKLNRLLQEALNPAAADKPETRFGELVFRNGDRVMQVRNNYDIVWEREHAPDDVGSGMFNGDVGEILEIDAQNESMLIRFDDKLAHYTFDMLGELELAYAMTVHKAQGSEFDAVILALSSGISRRLLTRNILYTAITRAKNLLVLVGSQEAAAYMVTTKARNKRYSALRVRLYEKGEGA